MKEYAILLDNTYCTGCNTCAYRCIQEFRYHEQAAKGLFRTFVTINDGGLYQKRCMHCLDPQCVKNCPVKALTKSGYGPVLYNADVCVGCQTCTRVCPFHVPQFDEASRKIIKCSLCAQRVGENRQPACVEVCPTGALQFGEYAAMKEKALKLAKDRKLNLYGNTENGGTHLFILAGDDFAASGYPKVAGRKIQLGALDLGGGLGVPAMAAAMAVTGFRKFSERKDRITRAEEAKQK
jgi:formate dehydrogenase iron-sulfur subunit